MEKKTTLDQWDFKLIQSLKTNAPMISNLQAILAERNAVKPEDIELVDLMNYLLDIVESFCKENDRDLFKLIIDSCNENQWKFNDLGLNKEKSTIKNWLRVLASRIRLTEVKYLPGYVEYIKSLKS